MDLEKTLRKVFLKSPENLFDAFIKEAQDFYSLPAHTLLELRQRDNRKIKGDIFEEFCALYLRCVKGYSDVWLLEDVPDDILVRLNMKRQDMGIDIIVRHSDEFYAVQCKYKKPGDRKTCISWQALSTFYALCLRTGPFKKYIVMTNCDYTRHQGKKTAADISICLGTFRKLNKEEWMKMSNMKGTAFVEEANANATATVETRNPETIEELRERRLKFYEKV